MFFPLLGNWVHQLIFFLRRQKLPKLYNSGKAIGVKSLQCIYY